MRRLRKLVLKALQESGITEDETKLSDTLEHKVGPSNGPCFCLFILWFG
jgi:hypothetical protein